VGEHENEQVVEQLWDLIAKEAWDEAGRLLHDDFVQEWPQSGERIRGRENCMAVNRNYPGLPKMSPRRFLSGGDLVTSEVTLDYGGRIYESVSIYEFRDGKVLRETDYFAEPFDAPGWRRQWVERM
jgi:ketosteroid isomerase-like protein